MRDNQDEINAFTQTILRLHNDIITPLKTGMSNSSTYLTPELNQRLDSLTQELQQLKAEAEGLATRGRWQRFLNAQDDIELLRKLNLELDQNIQRFMMSGGIASEMAITELDQKISTGFDNIEKRWDRSDSAFVAGQTELLTYAQLQLIKNLPRAHARHDSAVRNEAIGCFEGTRSNTLKEIADWVESTDRTRPIYWLRGAAGVGKSTIAQTVAEREDSKARLGASFFFSRDEATRRNALLVFPTIAFQLANFNPQLKRLIAESLEKHPDVGFSTMRQQVDKLIVGPLVEWGPSDRIIVIILDAFDECDPETGAREILTLWAAQIPRIPINIKILVTSRPELHIRNTFQLPVLRQISQQCILHNIEDSIVEADIELYLRHHLNEIAANCELEIPWPTDREVRMLTQYSGKLFIFAATVVKFAGDPKVCDPQGRLDLLLEERSSKERSRSRSRYQEVDQLYSQILNRSLPDDEDDREDAASHFRKVVGAIVILFDPLPSGPLEVLLCLPQGRAKRSLLHLHSVMLVPESLDGQIRVLHPSFRDFLTDAQRCSDPHFYIDPPVTHGRIAALCIEHLISSLRRDPIETGNAWILNSEINGLDQRVANAFKRHLQYCCIYFGSHVASARRDDLQFLHLLDVFLSTRLLMWIEALSLMYKIDSAIEALRAIKTWCSPIDEINPRIKELLSDAIRFLLQFKPSLRLGGGQLYVTALQHTPKSVLRQQYAHEMGPRYILRGILTGWEPCISVLRGCLRPYCAAFATGGEYIITAGISGDGHIIEVWSVLTSTEVGSYTGHESQITALACSGSASFAVSVSRSSPSVHIWDVVTGALLGKLLDFQGTIHEIRILQGEGGILTAGNDGVLRLWDPVTCALVSSYVLDRNHRITALTLSQDDCWVGFGSLDCAVAVWQLNANEPAHRLGLHTNSPAYKITFKERNNNMLVSLAGEEICIWNCEERTMVRSISILPRTKHLAISPDGVHAALVSEASSGIEYSVQLYRLDNWVLLTCLTGHSRQVNSITFSADGSHIVTAAQDSTVRLWDSNTGLKSGNPGTSQEVFNHTSLSGSEDGSRVLSASVIFNRVRFWDINKDTPLVEIETGITLVLLAQISPDGRWIATGGFSEVLDIQLWRTETMELTTTWTAGYGWDYEGPGATAFSRDGALLASSFFPNYRAGIYIWSTESYEQQKRIFGFRYPVLKLTFSRDSTRIFALSRGSGSCEVQMIDVLEGTTILKVDRPELNLGASSCLFYPDDSHILIRGKTPHFSTHVLESETLELAQTIENAPVSHVRRHADGRVELAIIRLDPDGALWEVVGSTSTRLCWLPDAWRTGQNTEAIHTTMICVGDRLVVGLKSGDIGVLDLEVLRQIHRQR